MAKRRRLIPSPLMAPDFDTNTAEIGFLETKAYLRPGLGAPAPIAQVAADASAQAALTELSDAMARARSEGRLVLRLALDQIETDYLVRDRISVDEEELGHLIASLRDHGQRTPIEVTELPSGRFDVCTVESIFALNLTLFVLSLLSYHSLLIINRSRTRWVPAKVRRYVFINAEKSSSGAIQVGGMVFSVMTVIGIYCVFRLFPQVLNPSQAKILSLAFYSWIGILIYGHLDDVFEIRPIVKLTMQLSVILIFCLRVSNVIYPEHSALAFIIMTGLSVLILNGTNLIDGLDTLTFKVSGSIFFGFALLASLTGNVSVLLLGFIFFSNMCGFYFVNRAPSKVHMGEVGVGSLGFAYVVLATLVFDGLRQRLPTISSLMLCLLPCVLPMVEISVSSVRRIMNNKSPFKGDKLHAHHILHIKKGFSSSTASSIIAGVNLTLFVVVHFLLAERSPVWAFPVLFLLVTTVYFALAHRIWFGEEFSFNLKFFESILVKKDVRIIPSDALSDFKIILPQNFNRRKTDQNPDKDER